MFIINKLELRQGIEHPPPKGRVARSNRAEGTIFHLSHCWISSISVLRSQTNYWFSAHFKHNEAFYGNHKTIKNNALASSNQASRFT